MARMSPPSASSISLPAMLSIRADNNSCASTVFRLSAPRGRPAGFPLCPFLKQHGCFPSCIFLFFCKKHPARGRMRSRNEKPGAARRPGFWRSFGEYALLEDSRYTSQAKN